ncbi:hypothetical protein [Mycolicibacterium stellerae]|uniref:hypothetical protein n=1 Tax=Mycolicibacterium stellerae TaxID=2358193 RepID=UPI000F0BAD16|nr:hypothetical protein [Mycolicibacterium stellerae]
MTTTYDTEFGTETIAAPLYDDPGAYTVAEAWASSPMDDIDDDSAAVDNGQDRGPAASRAKLFAALAAGIIGGATLGAVLFGYKPVAPPSVVVPGFGVSTSQLPGQAGTQGSPKAPQTPAATQAPTPKQLPQTTPNPVAAESKTNEEVAAAPAAPPVLAPPVVVDVFIPPLGEKPKPQAPAPEPPKPEPPVFDPPNIDVVQIPDESVPNNVVIEAPILDPALQKPTTNELKPVLGSRFNVNMPNTKKDDGPHRQVPSSRFNSLGKP